MNIYSNAALESDLTCGMRGYERRAEILLALPEEIRSAVVAESHRIMNVIGGRPTEALLIAVREVKVGEEAVAMEYKWTRQKNVRGELSYTSACGVINRIYETYSTRSVGSRTTYFNFVYEGTRFDTLTDAKYFAESYHTAKVSA